MRAVTLLFLPVLAALACVGAVAIATGSPGETQSFVWKKHAFTSKQEFAAWLERRNVSYAGWARRHPGASPPWEDEGVGLGRLAFLVGALALILALLVLARDTVSGFARAALLSVARLRSEETTLRVLAPANSGHSLRDAVSVYGLRAPRGATPRQEPERPELVLVEGPLADSVAAVEPEVAMAVEPAPGAAVATGPEPEMAVDAPRDSPAPLEPAPAAPSADREAALVQPMDAGIPIDQVPVDALAPESPSPFEPHRATAPPTWPSEEVVCEVAFWPGYVRGQFYARIRGDEFSAVATSPLFRCRSATPGQTEECHAALAALNDRLVAEGWQANGRGRAWYAMRFTNSDAA